MERDREVGRGREVRRLGAASILLDFLPEGGGGVGVRSQRFASKDFPSRHDPLVSSQHTHEQRSRFNRLSRRNLPHEGLFMASTIGGVGVAPLGGGGGGSGSSVKEGVIFAESPVTPGIPVVYRTPEERNMNPDRLNLDRRHLTVCPILEGEEHLRLLNLQHNAITRLQHLGSLRRLVFLDLYDNLITDISGLEGLHALRVLMLGRNRIHRICGLQSLTRLDVLDLHGNMIREICNLSHLTHLRVLNLAGNDIAIVEGLSGLVSLAELNLRRNRITQCAIDELPSLQRVYLSHNLIQSHDDIACLSSCKALTDLSMDGNPLANLQDYRKILLSQFSSLGTLNQTPITDEERAEAVRAAQKEERKMREMNRKARLEEERLVTLATIREEWENCSEEEVKSSSNYFIDCDGDHLSLYGAGSLGNLQSIRLGTVASLNLHYIDFTDIHRMLLSPLKEKLTNVKAIELNSVNIRTLTQVEQLSLCLPSSVTSVAISPRDDNMVTTHPLYGGWVDHVFPPQVDVKGVERGSANKESGIFEPLKKLQSETTLYTQMQRYGESSRHYACGFADSVFQVTLANYRKQQLFEEVWPDLVDSLIQETLEWTDNVLSNT